MKNTKITLIAWPIKNSLRNAFGKRDQTVLAHFLLLSAALAFFTGCGVVTVRHVPKVAAITGDKMSDLHGGQPLDIKSGECSSAETKFGSVGMGKVVGIPAEWTAVTVEAARKNLAARGATISSDASKVLTITMTKAEVHGIPMTGVTKSKIVLTATTAEGLNSISEGSSSSMAPLSAVDGAVTDAVKKLLSDPAVDAYVRK